MYQLMARLYGNNNLPDSSNMCHESTSVGLPRRGFAVGDRVTAVTVASDDMERSVEGLRVTTYDIPKGCVAGYYPECNPLIPLWHHAEGSFVPAAKSTPIRLRMA